MRLGTECGYVGVFALLVYPVEFCLRGLLDEAVVGYLRGLYSEFAGMVPGSFLVVVVCVSEPSR